jgi:hypothetical protein
VRLADLKIGWCGGARGTIGDLGGAAVPATVRGLYGRWRGVDWRTEGVVVKMWTRMRQAGAGSVAVRLVLAKMNRAAWIVGSAMTAGDLAGGRLME